MSTGDIVYLVGKRKSKDELLTKIIEENSFDIIINYCANGHSGYHNSVYPEHNLDRSHDQNTWNGITNTTILDSLQKTSIKLCVLVYRDEMPDKILLDSEICLIVLDQRVLHLDLSKLVDRNVKIYVNRSNDICENKKLLKQLENFYSHDVILQDNSNKSKNLKFDVFLPVHAQIKIPNC